MDGLKAKLGPFKIFRDSERFRTQVRLHLNFRVLHFHLFALLMKTLSCANEVAYRCLSFVKSFCKEKCFPCIYQIWMNFQITAKRNGSAIFNAHYQQLWKILGFGRFQTLFQKNRKILSRLRIAWRKMFVIFRKKV